MDEGIFWFFYHLATRSPIFSAVAVFLARDLIWVLLVGFLFCAKYFHFSRREVFLIIICVLSAWAVSLLIKVLYLSPRPFALLSDLTPLIKTREALTSFPSSHTIVVAALAGALLLTGSYYLGIIFGIGAILVGLGRVMVGVHWPSDVLAGLVFGFLTVWIVKLALKFYTFK